MADPNNTEPGPSVRAPGIDWRRLHLWQIQPVRDVLVVLCLIGLVYFGHMVRVVTIPLLLAMLFAYLFEPVIDLITHRTRLSRQRAVGALLAAVVLFVVVPVVIGAGFAVVQVAGAASSVATNSQNLLESVRAETPAARSDAYARLEGHGWQSVSDWLKDLNESVQLRGGADSPIDEAANPEVSPPLLHVIPFSESGRKGTYRVAEFVLGWVKDNAEAIGAAASKRAIGTGTDAVGAAIRAVGAVGYVAFTAFLTAFFFYFISTGYGKVLEFWKELIPERKKGMAIDLASKMNVAVSGFVRGRLTIAAIQSVVFAIGYLLIGVPGWIILGPLVAFLSIIPYAALVGVPVSIILLYLHPNAFEFQDAIWWTLGAPIALYVAGQALDDYVLTPAIQGKSTGMDTPTILFASLAGGAVAGIYGLLIAIPVAACIKILLQDVFWPRFKRWAQGKERDFLPISN